MSVSTESSLFERGYTNRTVLVFLSIIFVLCVFSLSSKMQRPFARE